MTPPDDVVKIAQEIVGKWGYEEPYWWQPIAEALAQARMEERTRITYELGKLNWMHILRDAINNRPACWHKSSILQWRNASDEIYHALLKAGIKVGIFADTWKEASKVLKAEGGNK